MSKQKGINAKAWFCSQSFISSAQAEAERPVHMVCAETCTDEEFGGYFVDEAAAMKVARKHPHAVQILPVSIEEFREARKPPVAAPSGDGYNHEDYGGAFDGTRVYSDADEGL